MIFNNLILLILIKKMIKNGKKRHAIKLLKNYFLLDNEGKLLYTAILKLLSPVFSQRNVNKSFSHYYFSFSKVSEWLLNIVKEKNKSKLPFFKALYLENRNILKGQSKTLLYRKKYIKNILSSGKTVI